MRVELREVREGDLEALYAFQAEPEIVASGFVPHREHDAFLTHMRWAMGVPGSIMRAVEVDGALAGSIVKFERGGVFEVGYLIGKPFWGQGIASRALEALLKLTDDRPLYGVCVAENVASQRVLQKCGFRLDHKVVEVDGTLLFHFVLV